MHLALAPALYRARGIPEFTQIFIHDAMLNCCRRSSLQARPRQSPFAPTQGLHFQALHPLSLLFICTLHWCKHYTRQDVCPEFTQISIHGSMRNCCRRSSFACPSSTVHVLHQPRIYIFRFSITLASFSLAPFIGASIVPG